jgi:tetratricopeptide (TPR) repeat protein
MIVTALLLAVLVLTARGDEISRRERDRYIREANNLAKKGDRQGAVRKLENLHSSLPGDLVVVRALFEMLVESKQFERAEYVMKEYLRSRPQDVNGLAALASLYIKTGDTQEAMSIIDRVLAMSPSEAWSYQLAYRVLMDGDLGNRALDIIFKARGALGDSTLFAADAAEIHADRGEYAKAVRQYMLASMSGADPDKVTTRILNMAKKPAARESITGALRRALGVRAFDTAARRVLWKTYLAEGACEASLAELTILTERDRSYARFLSAFASEAKAQGCYGECSKAYELAAHHADNSADQAMFLLDQGKCQVMGGLTEDAILSYRKVAREFGKSRWAHEALLCLGGIYRDLGELGEAMAHADMVIAARDAGEHRYDAIVFKGDCLVLMGRLDDAFKTYDLVETSWQSGYAQEAFFNLAEIRFYQANFDEAISYYNVTMREYPDEARANDAIDRLILLKQSRDGQAYLPLLTDLSQAVLLRRQGRTADAFTILSDLAEAASGAIKVESLKGLSEIFLERGAHDRAIKIYRLIADTLDTYFSPTALETVGDILLGAGRTQDAIDTYEEVILRFPDSVAAGDARRKIDLAENRAAQGS